ncbi:MAG TPA: class I SAM-dependent methyltransferase [Gammaproteobacteria bacterium]|nr:class I SAM-dependent methyltransferase [Gammaproteobacteria bacterium]
MDNLKKVESHYKFGENWKDFSTQINNARIEAAQQGLIKLFGPEGLSGKTFLDIGCGSGLSTLAAILLGAKKVVSIDIDEVSVATTTRLLQHYKVSNKAHVETLSVFDMHQRPDIIQQFDVVYSWGVLHHTGNLAEAMQLAKRCVKPGGLLMLALYNKTTMCSFWAKEKKIYVASPFVLKRLFEFIFQIIHAFRLLIKRRNVFKFYKGYQTRRGMSFIHDVRDWLGGYPYQSISAQGCEKWAEENHMDIINSFALPPSFGLLGSGCHEYVFKVKD